MNPWLSALIGILIGTLVIYGVERFKERRGKKLSEFEDFDIDYNAYTRQVEPGFADLLQNVTRPQSFVTFPPSDAELSLGLVDDRLLEKNKRAYEEETELALGITKEARGYGIMASQCNQLNPDEKYPFYCVRHVSHIHHVDPKVRRHGYAGVFWD